MVSVLPVTRITPRPLRLALVHLGNEEPPRSECVQQLLVGAPNPKFGLYSFDERHSLLADLTTNFQPMHNCRRVDFSALDSVLDEDRFPMLDMRYHYEALFLA
jgi:hypothetical protein